MKKQIDNFNSKIFQNTNKQILADLNAKQESGQIRDLTTLRAQMTSKLAEAKSAGKIIKPLNLPSYDILYSESFMEFFDQARQDINVLFDEIDQTELSFFNTQEIIKTDLRNLDYAIGQINAQFISKSLQIPPGSGWSIIQRDSFESGYGNLLGRAELPFDLFKDVRTGLIKDGEINPIKSDAKVETVGKKLILPEIENKIIGFSDISISAQTTATLNFGNTLPLDHVIDNDPNTFWIYSLATDKPFLGTPAAEIKQIAGPTTVNLTTINLSGLLDNRKQDYYLQVISINDFRYKCLNQITDAPVSCKWDVENKCYWGYEDFYNQNCLNNSCSRFKLNTLTTTSGIGILEDGYGNETGALVNFSGLYSAGQVFQVSIKPSGVVGADLTLRLTVKNPGAVNWIEIDPIAGASFTISKLEYTKPNTLTKIPITSSSIRLLDKIRIDFPPIDAGEIYITFNQPNHFWLNSIINPIDVIQQQIIDYRDSEKLKPIKDLLLEPLLEKYLRQEHKKVILSSINNQTQKFEGYIYQFGIAGITCGLTKYFDIAIAAARRVRAITPRLFGIQCNLEEDIDINEDILTENTGTIEFSITKLNYDKNKTLINIDDFPLPYTDTNGMITERLYVNEIGIADLRFYTTTINEIKVLSLNKTLTSDDYLLVNKSGATPSSSITFLNNQINSSSIVIVKYVPSGGVYINNSQTIRLEDNTTKRISFSDIKYLVNTSNKSANRDIDYSDVYLRIILRRNNPNLFTTPALRDYKLFISENNQSRFF